jgi:multiple sugar transport system permease protein
MPVSTIERSIRTTTAQGRRWHLRRHTYDDIGVVGTVVRWGVLLFFALYFVVPMVWLFVAPSKDPAQLYSLHPLAFGTWARIAKAWQNLTNYQGGTIWRWFGNSILYAVSSLALGLATSVPAGYILAVARFPGRNLLLWLTLIAMLLPTSALVLPLFLELNLVHLVNTSMSVILPACFFPFGVYLAYVYYGSSLPRDLLDAARMDGCSEVGVFWNIALPTAKPLIGLLAFISFTANWNNFFGPYVMLNDDKLFNLPVGVQTVISSTAAIRPGFNPTPGALSFQQADAALAGLVMIAPVIVVFLFSQRYVTRGAFTGSVKG